MGNRPAPAPQIARRGHRAPGTRSRLKAGGPSRRTGIAGFPAGSAPTRRTGIAGFPAGSAPTRLTGIAGFPAGSAPTRLDAASAASGPTRGTCAVVRPAARPGQPPGSRAADRAPGASSPRHAKPAESRRSQSAADRDRRLSSRLGADAADWDRRLSSRLGADAADWDRRLSSRLGADAARCRVGGVWADKRAHAQSSARRRGLGNRPAPAPQIARRGHRAPGTRSRLKAGGPSRPAFQPARRRRGGLGSPAFQPARRRRGSMPRRRRLGRQEAHAQSSAPRRGMGNRPAPAPQIARRGHRAPGTRSRLKAGGPSRRTGIAGFPAGSPTPTRRQPARRRRGSMPRRRRLGHARRPPAARPGQRSGSRAADRAPGASSPRHAKPAESRRSQSAADRDRRLSSRLAADAADRDRRLSSRLGADAADWDRRLSSRLGADAARCRVGGVWADKKAHAQSSARRRGLGNRPAPAPQIARRGHRAPGTRSRLKAGGPSRRTGIAGFPAGSAPTRLDAASAAPGPIREPMRSRPPRGAAWATVRLPRRRSRAGGIEPPAREAG
jgi:hypothetical protein